MTRTRAFLLVAAAGLVLLILALAMRRSDVVVGKPHLRAIVPPPMETFRTELNPASAAVVQAQQELLALCAERDRLLRLKKDLERPQEAIVTPADMHYRLAERFFQSGDPRCETECEKALQSDPNHLPARSLLTEIRFLINRIRSDSEQSRLAEIDNVYLRGCRHYSAREYDAAEREFRKFLQLAIAEPQNTEVHSRRASVLDLLDRLKSVRR